MRWIVMAGLTCMFGVAACGGGGSNTTTGNNNGGSGGTPSGSNVEPVTVDSGPAAVANSNSPSVNTLYVKVSICVPGTTTCQTIDHIQVDTGSTGLRILSSVLTLNLPVQNDGSGHVIAECTQFVDGSSWGPLRKADIKIAGEVASSQPVQIIGDSTYPVPSACSTQSNGKIENTVTAFGANGILGIGPFLQDCGSGCTVQGNSIYYTCPTPTTCADSAIPLALQVTNPVAAFATDNNGIIIQLNPVNGTAASVSGSLIFGIGTQGNNGIGAAQVFTLNNEGGLSTTYKGKPLSHSFIDSGSNAYYFEDSINVCAQNTVAPGFFCPGSTLSLSGTIVGINNASATINFKVADAVMLFSTNSTIAAADGLAGSISQVGVSSGSLSDTFDWGLPFYFGRSVYTAIEGKNTSVGAGPYFAF